MDGPTKRLSMAGRITITAEVVGVGSDGTEPSVVFAVHRRGVYSADQTLLKRYLFNCGEGTQRLCGENGVKLNSLDAIFLTRLDVRSASGVPGLVFALGGLGAAHLRVHGPMGTRERLGAMGSFVRRRYPKIECFEVENADHDLTSVEDDQSEIEGRHWAAGEPQEDAYARVVAVPLAGECGNVPTCWICAKCMPLEEKPEAAPPSTQATSGDEIETGTQDPDRRWLRRFYESKGLREKIPHMDAILRRYSGRMDELKAQLINKYGGGDSSDDSDSSSSESEDNGDKSVVDTSAPLDREWLEAFYQRHEPVKVARVDQILRQFAGREDQLKGMLLSKYSEDDKPTDSVGPPAKKQRIGDAQVATPRDAEDSTVTESIPEVLIDEEAWSADDAPTESLPSSSESPLCYILQFRAPPFPVVWIVDCQTTHLIDSLSSRMAAVGNCSHRPVLVVHFSSTRVMSHPKYQNWIKTLDGSGESSVIEHLVFGGRALRKMADGVFSFAFVASARNYLKHQTSESLPQASRWESLQRLLASGSSLQLGLRKRLQEATVVASVAQAKLKFTLEATAIADYSHTGWKYIVEKKSVDHEEEDVPPAPLPSPSPRHHRQGGRRTLSILGTGSAAPSKLRASTSMYLSLSPEPVNLSLPGMLIDCGEGAFGQLQRQFDSDAALAARLAGLKCIWISHHHADHQCGLLRVLDEYVRLPSTCSRDGVSLYVVAPQSVLEYAQAWLPSLPSNIRLLTCAEMNDYPRDLLQHLRDYVQDMRNVRVWHCHDAYGLILRFHDGTKLVYSGDTKPCDQLVRAGMDASLLIHEATFDDSMADDADKKKHTTVGQAIGVARRMRAKRLVLTHFSQRYPALPPPMSTDAVGSTASPLEISCAYDGFTVAV